MRTRFWIAVCGLTLLAFALRVLGFEDVFPGGGDVILAVGDAHYHLRRALYSLANFPSLLTFDSYINFPDGGVVPVPPLYDWLPAGFVRAVGGGPLLLERMMAWVAPVSGALAIIPVCLLGRRLGGLGVGLGAGGLVAILPGLVTIARVGDADHHGTVILLGAWLLYATLRAADPELPRERVPIVAGSLATARILLVLTWSGSLLYLVPSCAALVGAGVLTGRRRVLCIEAGVSAVSGGAILAVAANLPEPPGGAYSAVSLSLLHAALPLASAGVAVLLASAESRWPSRGVLHGVLRLGLAGGLVLGAFLLVPGLREALLGLASFLSAAEGTNTSAASQGGSGRAVVELLPLFSILGRESRGVAFNLFGWLAFAVPLAPLLPWSTRPPPGRRTLPVLLTSWLLLITPLAIWQVRFAADFAPAGSVAMALGARSVIRALGRLPRVSSRLAAGAVVGLVLLARSAPLRGLVLSRLAGSVAALTGAEPADDRTLATPAGSMTRFLRQVRAATPETSGFLDSRERPEYGVLARVNLGHALHHVARRASASNGFLDLLGPENFVASQRFFRLRDEQPAVSIAADLEARYVITAFFPGMDPGTVEGRLHGWDGRAAADAPPLTRFRLVTEGPRGGAPLGDLFGLPRPPGVVPYKLFEIVPGALLEVAGEPGQTARARVVIVTVAGRRFVWENDSIVEPDGLARIRIPYATDLKARTRAVGPVVVEVGPRRHTVQVANADVVKGGSVPVP